MEDETQNIEEPVETNGTSEPQVISLTEEEWTQCKKEAEDYKDKYLRLLAETENTRKRLQKDRDEMVQYAIKNLLLEFLHPIDHFETALSFTEQSGDEVKHWALGFKMLLTQFKEVLGNHGVTPIEAKGKPFDPHLHEAIEMIETEEHPPGVIVEESGRGYLINEKMLRPSRVKVSKESPSNETN